ncbi:MAG: HupE/UreJ family protein [Actinomycetota bacterium]
MRRPPETGQDDPGRRRPRRLARLVTLIPALAMLAVLAMAGPSSAHSGEQSYLYLDVTQTSLGGRVEVPFGDLEEVLGIDLDGSREEALATLEANEAAIETYLTEHLALGPGADGAGDWAVTFGGIELFESDEPEDSLDYAVLDFTVAATDPVPRTFDLRFDPFVDEINGRDHLLLIANDWEAGVIDNGFDTLLAFDAGSRVQEVDLGDTSVLQNLWSSIKLGINHIETGPDHILFVLVLLLPSVLVWQGGRWLPVDDFGAALWRITKIVTMFTVAHSITFTLAGLGFLPLPGPRIVESIIALSIAAAAIHNLRPLAANREWLISFVFGLFHGMGFASLVSGLDVPRGTQLISLLGRNIGIEIGQVVVVLVLFPVLFLLRRLFVYRPLFIVGSVLLAIVAVGWAIERSLEVSLGVDNLVDPIFVYPRIFILVLLATLAAGFFYRNQQEAGRLLPTASGADDESAEVDSAESVPS